MLCMLKFCQWKALWWAEQAPCCSGLHAPLAEGLQAYAAEQANMEHCICLAGPPNGPLHTSSPSLSYRLHWERSLQHLQEAMDSMDITLSLLDSQIID